MNLPMIRTYPTLITILFNHRADNFGKLMNMFSVIQLAFNSSNALFALLRGLPKPKQLILSTRHDHIPAWLR